MCSRHPEPGAGHPDIAELTALRERLIDAEGEAGACSDNECSCRRLVNELRWELDDLEGGAA